MVPRLTASYSQALQNLVRAGQRLPINGAPLVDGMEVGPWFTVEQIARYRRQLPGCPFHFHAGSLAGRVRAWPPTLGRVPRYLACTENAWLSMHVELLPWPLYLLGSRLGIHLPPPDAERAARRLVRTVEKVRSAVGLPVILENLASLPVASYHYAADPAILAGVLDAAGCDLLLDLAHARLAAIYRGQPAEEYVSALPLERVRQVHVSGIRYGPGCRGTRRRRGRWYDAHESMQEEDYALLAWTLDRCRPEVVTLEYFRQEAALAEQIRRLRALLGGLRTADPVTTSARSGGGPRSDSQKMEEVP
jgi:hypothetical protein